MTSGGVFEQLLGEELVQPGTKDRVKVGEALANARAIGIYFSAHWCPPCRGFTPRLAERYKALKEAGKQVEVVFVSSDRSEDEFEAYHSEMPWLALPFPDRDRKQSLSGKYGVRGIPTLVFVDGVTGETITDEGRHAVLAESFQEDFPYHPKPVNDLLVWSGPDAPGLKGTSLLLLMEGLPETEQLALEAALEEVAVEELEKPSSERAVQAFFTAGKAGGLATRVRTVCGLPHPEATSNEGAELAKPSMLILDLSDPGEATFVLADDQLLLAPPSGQSIKEFLRAFQNKALEAKPLMQEEE